MDHARKRVAGTSSTGIPAPSQAQPEFHGEMTIFSTALSCNRSGGSIVLSNVHAFRVKASQIHQHYHNMDILVSTLCDFAADYQGKLCIQGGFDSLVARQFPVVHPVCAVALRVCLP
ncbi:hypothetical protein F3D15_24370, partial [Bacteroides ovatus]